MSKPLMDAVLQQRVEELERSGARVPSIQGALYSIDGEVPGWCYHALFILKGDDLIDTYWGIGSDTRRLHINKARGRMRLLLDLNNARLTHRDEYETFDENERAWIPIGGGAQQFWVSTHAKPNPQKVREQLESKIESERSKIRCAESSIRWYEQQLAELGAQEPK